MQFVLNIKIFYFLVITSIKNNMKKVKKEIIKTPNWIEVEKLFSEGWDLKFIVFNNHDDYFWYFLERDYEDIN